MPYWTLTYELVFYIAMGLILALGMLRWTEWFGLLAVAVSCLFIATLDVRLHHRSSIVLLVYYSNFFLIGICLYRIHARMARPATWAALVVAITVTVLGGGERSFDTPGRDLPAAHHRLHGLRLVRHQPAWQVACLAAICLPGTDILSALSRSRRAGLRGHPLGRGARLEHDRGRCRRRARLPDRGDIAALSGRAAGRPLGADHVGPPTAAGDGGPEGRITPPSLFLTSAGSGTAFNERASPAFFAQIRVSLPCAAIWPEASRKTWLMVKELRPNRETWLSTTASRRAARRA